MLKSFLNPIISTINAYLKLDPESQSRLNALEGKIISVILLPFNTVFTCTFTNSSMQLLTDDNIVPDTTIRGTPLNLAGVAIAKENRQQFFADDIEITGDTEIAQQVIALFDELEIDWEEQASRFVGDVPAYHAGRMATKLRGFAKKLSGSFTQNISEYLHEEKEWLPAREMMEDFFKDIDELRMAVDRAQAKITLLNQSIETEKDSQDKRHK